MNHLISHLGQAAVMGDIWGSLLEWGPYLLAGGAAGAIVVVLWLVVRFVFGTPQEGGDELDEPEEGVFGALTPALAAQIPETEKESTDFARLLRQAGMYRPTAAANIYALRFVLLFGTAVLVGLLALLAPQPYFWPVLIVGVIVAGGLSVIPRLYVFFRRRRRIREIRNGLADMMDMLSMCMGGGLPLSPSLDHVSKNLIAHPALAQELQILKRQAELGSLKLALADFARRVDLPEGRLVAQQLTRGDQLGTQVTGSLLEQADHFRAARRQAAIMQANKAPVKLTFPLLLCFAPAALILLISPAILELARFFRTGPEGAAVTAESIAAPSVQVSEALEDARRQAEFDRLNP